MTVLWHVSMSLDGFIAGPDDAMDWAFGYEERSPWTDDIVAATGAIVAGRNWYDAATEKYDGRRGIYGGDWDGPVFVLTHDPPEHEPDPGITFVTGGVRAALATATQAAPGKAVGIFGAETARQFIAEGLIDEIVVHVAPVLLGDGVRLYESPGTEHVQLERTGALSTGRLTDLRFRVLR